MKRKDAYLLLITTFILILAWVIITIFNSANNSTISGNLNTQILPIQPSFDEKTINLLKQRKQITPENTIPLLDDEGNTIATPTGQLALPTTIPSVTSTNSASQ